MNTLKCMDALSQVKFAYLWDLPRKFLMVLQVSSVHLRATLSQRCDRNR